MCVYIREGGDFYNPRDDTPYIYGIQRMIEAIVRRGRSVGSSEIMVVMDTQYPSDLPDSLLSGFNKKIAFRTTTTESKKFLRSADIPYLYLLKLSGAQVGQSMQIVGGQFKYPVTTLPTSHKKADIDFDVFQYLGGKFGWTDYSNSKFIDIILNPATEDAEFSVPQDYYA